MKLKAIAKELYNKHLKLCTPDGYQSEKQMEMYRNEATMDAILEALEMGLFSEEEE